MSSPRNGTGSLLLYAVETPAGRGWLGMAGDTVAWLSIGALRLAEVRAYWKGPVAKARDCPLSAADLRDAAAGRRHLKLAPRGTPFQQRVWRELQRIPLSVTTSYGDLACQLGSAGKARAVGTAVGANPIAWLIPCHRVLPAAGGLGGYRWGQPAKRKLLDWERNGQPAPSPVQPAEDKRRLEELLLNAQRFEDIARLAGSIAHDLNNLLAPIRMATELLKRKLTDSSVNRYLDIIEDSTGRARAVIQEILAFARESETSQAQLININDLLAELERMARETFPAGVRLDFHYQPEAPPVEIDPHQLHRAVLNLLVNARDAIRETGTITVAVSTHDLEMRVCVGERCLVPGRYACISVADDGCGIPDGIREQIFDPFFTTKPKEKGTGLGLSTVLSVIARAGGFIDLESTVGKGSTFHLFIPEKR